MEAQKKGNQCYRKTGSGKIQRRGHELRGQTIWRNGTGDTRTV